VARSRNRLPWKGTVRFFFVVFFLCVDVAVNNMKVFSVAMQMEKWIPFALLSSYEIFRTAVYNNY